VPPRHRVLRTSLPTNHFSVGYNQWIGSVGVFLAKEKGYFKDAGLNVEMKQFAGPADSVPPLIAGQLDAALTTADTPILLSKEANSNPLTTSSSLTHQRVQMPSWHRQGLTA
jgi:ABC-type nitrate/sulfonate/bicarbonate transport system substrate-binding protein